MNDRKRAIYFEGQYKKFEADLKWTREQLHESHRIIGVLIQATTVGAGVVTNINHYWPGLHPQAKSPGEEALKQFEKQISGSKS